MPGLGTGLKAHLKRITGKTAGKRTAPYCYPPWLNEDLAERFAMQDRWDARWETLFTGVNTHARHTLHHDALMSPTWNTDDLAMTGSLTTPEERDPYLDLRLVNFVLSLPPMPWLYQKHVLRQGMKNVLPRAVIERPKQALGDLASSLIGQAAFDTHQPGSDLDKYVNAAAFSKAMAGIGDTGLNYVNLRPLVLRQWLQML
jgi:asparagine synthase (glutamine-hydrolysing)